MHPIQEHQDSQSKCLTFRKQRSWHVIPSLQGKSVEKQRKQWLSLSFWAPKPLQVVTAAMKLKDTPWKQSYDQPRQHIKKQRHYFTNKGSSSQGYCFSSSRVWMWELDYKESWAPKDWCFWTVVLEKTESPLDWKEIQPVHPKGDQSWVFIGRTDAKAETLNTLATWCEKIDSLKQTLMLGKIEGWRRRGQ